jgi:hypothetical protein
VKLLARVMGALSVWLCDVRVAWVEGGRTDGLGIRAVGGRVRWRVGAGLRAVTKGSRIKRRGRGGERRMLRSWASPCAAVVATV